MKVFWLQPLAWWGLAALAIPILIHLLVRQHSRRVPFPSLRFLRATRLAAARRHVIADWPLLTLRLSILTAVIAALAAPVFVSAARKQSWNARVARAVVVMSAGSDVARLVEEERAGGFTSAVFGPASTPADALRDASAWLQRQPPAAREVVVIGEFRAGSLSGRDLDLIAPSTGVRLLPVASLDRLRTARLAAIAEPAPGAGVTRMLLDVTLEDQTTTIRPQAPGIPSTRPPPRSLGASRSQAQRIRPSTEQITDAVRGGPLEVRAAPDAQAAADAALRAVLAEGLVLPREVNRRVVIDFHGAPDAGSPIAQPATHAWMRQALERLPELRGGERKGALVVQAAVGGADARAVQLIATIVRRALADDLRDLEPRLIPASTLAAWSRPSGPVPDDVRTGDEGDRRVLWMAALVLLSIEHLMRRSRVAPSANAGAGSDDTEARVA